MIIYQVKLICQTGTSNKFYNIRIEKEVVNGLTTYPVKSAYGPIGGRPQSADQGACNTESEARVKLNSLMNQKLKKGYQLIDTFDVSSQSQQTQPQTQPTAQAKAESSKHDPFEGIEMDFSL